MCWTWARNQINLTDPNIKVSTQIIILRIIKQIKYFHEMGPEKVNGDLIFINFMTEK